MGIVLSHADKIGLWKLQISTSRILLAVAQPTYRGISQDTWNELSATLCNACNNSLVGEPGSSTFPRQSSRLSKETEQNRPWPGFNTKVSTAALERAL